MNTLLADAVHDLASGIRSGGFEGLSPLEFNSDVLGHRLSGLQRELIASVWEVEKTAAKGGHGTGKTHAAAGAALAFLYLHPGSTVLVSSATARQAKLQVWGTMRRLVRTAVESLPGEFNEIIGRPDPERKEWAAVQFATDNPDFFSGFHAEDLLVVVDESPGVGEIMWEAIKGCLASENAHLLALGNPTCSAGTFYEAFQPGSPWNTLTFDCLKHPNVRYGKQIYPGAVTRRWLADRRADGYDEDSVFWRTRVRGEFPKQGTDVLVSREWIDLALERNPAREGRPVLGCDVARYGTDETVVVARDGGEILGLRALSTSSIPEVIGLVVRMAGKYKVDPANVVVDDGGVGGGVTDGLRELDGAWGAVTPFLFGAKADDPDRFANRKAEIYWRGRHALDPHTSGVKLQLPKDSVLLSQMDVKYTLDSKGRIKIESKDDVKKRKRGMSPDRFEALLLTYANDEPTVDLDTEWGNEEDYVREQKTLVGVFGDVEEYQED